MADSKFSKKKIRDEVPGKPNSAVSGKRLENLCQPCSNADKRTGAEFWCLDCSEYLCSSCSKTHKQFTISREHTIAGADEAVKRNFPYKMKGLDQCKEHSKLLEYVCEDDDLLCCSTCAIAKHRKCHSVVEIENKAKDNANDLSNVTQDLIDIESKAKAYAQRLVNIRGKVTTDATEITNKIQEMQDKVNEMFENLKKSVAMEMNLLQQQVFQEIDKKNDVCNSYITDVTESLSQIDNVRHQGTPSQQLIMAYHFSNQVKALKENTDKDISDLKDIIMMYDFNESIILPPGSNTEPGKLTMKYVPSEVTNFKNSNQNDQEGNLTLMASVDLKQGDDDRKQPLYSGMDFMPDGRLVVVDNKNKKCLVYNQELENVGSGVLPETACNVAVMTEGQLAVSGGPYIYIIKISKSNKVTVIRTLKLKMNCDSICMMTDESFLVGCFDDPQPVRVISVDGHEKPLAINFPSKQYNLDESSCTYIKNRNKVILSDRSAHKVYIYGEARDTIVEVKDEKIIKEPRDVAVGPADCIFVGSDKTNSIVQISHTGQLLSSHVLDMWYPRCVCVSKDNKRLAVSNSADGLRRLQLYNIELM